MRFKRIWVHKHFFQSKIVLGYFHGGRGHGQSKGRGVRGGFGKEG